MRYSDVLAKFASFVVLLLAAPSPARSQFTTIINVPPNTIGQDTTFGAGTQVNIFEGAAINGSIYVVGGELNLYGATINYIGVEDAGVVNTLGGAISFAIIRDAGVLNMSNGLFESLRVLRGGVVNMSGGAFEPPFGTLQLDTGAVLNLSGGTFSNGFTGGTVNVFGGEYRLDGVPISGLDTIGSKSMLHVPDGSVLTGTLKDGTPISFPTGTLNLEVVALPDAMLREIFASTDPVPTGVRNGQTLIVDNGGAVGDHFRAGWGSAVRVEAGGRMGRDFDALSNSIVNISGGAVGDYFFAAAGSEITITGGMICHGFVASYGSAVNVRGGSIGREFTSGAQLHISGGSIGRVLRTAGATLLGADFRLDNVPIGGLNVVGTRR